MTNITVKTEDILILLNPNALTTTEIVRNNTLIEIIQLGMQLDPHEKLKEAFIAGNFLSHYKALSLEKRGDIVTESNNSKLHMVKRLKEYTGIGLKESKFICDIYLDGTSTIELQVC